MAQAIAADLTATSLMARQRHRSGRPLHGDMQRPMLIHRPTSDELALHGAGASFAQAMNVLRRALDDDAAMSVFRRILPAGGARLASDHDVLRRVAREVARGRMLVVSRQGADEPGASRYAAATNRAYRTILTNSFVETTDHMWQDTGGVVTVGVGKQLPTPSAALLLKFVYRNRLGPATPAEINAAYMTVRAAIPNGTPLSYRRLTDLDLAPGEAERQLTADLMRTEDDCRRLFPGWARFPLPAQIALLDMIFAPGELDGSGGASAYAGERQRQGPLQVQKVRQAVLRQDWAAASRVCRRAGIAPARNSWTASQFLNAAEKSPPRPEPHRAVRF
ncbi:MAG TPA: hypothetical protein VFE13_09230 [Caulobacteraceae bacterium]|nr:hypothetical protein [Caulobacteraceae bacterium]